MNRVFENCTARNDYVCRVFENRTARNDYVCSKCGQPILKGTKYKDVERIYGSWGGMCSVHNRMHTTCSRPKLNLKHTGREPVTYAGYKEWLIGKMLFLGEIYLLTQDWDETAYHKREVVYDEAGNAIRPEMVEV